MEKKKNAKPDAAETRRNGFGWFEVKVDAPGTHALTGAPLVQGTKVFIEKAHASEAFFKPCDPPKKGPAHGKESGAPAEAGAPKKEVK